MVLNLKYLEVIYKVEFFHENSTGYTLDRASIILSYFSEYKLLFVFLIVL